MAGAVSALATISLRGLWQRGRGIATLYVTLTVPAAVASENVQCPTIIRTTALAGSAGIRAALIPAGVPF
jgi:hypothetical protein